MHILLNGEIYSTKNRTTLHDLIQELNFTHTNFAVAVNFKVIPRSNYLELWLKEHDKIEIVMAFQGG